MPDPRALFLGGEVDAALAAYDRELSERPADAKLLAERAGVRFYKGDREGARADAEKAIEIDSSCGEAHLARARLLQFESAARAIEVAGRVLELDPQNAPAAYWRGLWKAAAGDLEGSKADLSRAAQAPGDEVRACQYRGLAKTALRDHAGAVKEFDRSVELGMNLPGLYFARAQAKSGLGDRRGAIEDLGRALERGPASATLHLERGRERLLDGDREGAIADFDQALRLDPNSTASYYLRAKARPATERIAAQQDFVRACATDPVDADGFLFRGLAKEEAERPMESIPDFARALELAPFFHPRRDEIERKVQAGPKRPSRSILDREYRPWLSFVIAAASILVFVIQFNSKIDLSPPQEWETLQTLIRRGALFRPLVQSGEYWRLFTSMFLHIGLLHLAWNMYGGISWCLAVERTIGPWRYLACYLMSGIGGSAASVLGHFSVSAGASGALFGMIGTALALYFVNLRGWSTFLAHPQVRSILINIAIWTGIGMAALNLDNYAHFGGLFFGALFGWLFVGASRLAPPKRIAAWAFGLLLWGGVVVGACVPRAGSPGMGLQLLEKPEESLKAIEESIRENPSRPENYIVRGQLYKLMGQREKALQDFRRALDLLDPGDEHRMLVERMIQQMERGPDR